MALQGMAEALREYLARGWSLLPVEPRGKRPEMALLPERWDEAAGKPVRSWRPFQTEQVTEAVALGWLAAEPELNVGIVTGALSGLVVLELDTSAAVAEALRRGIGGAPLATSGRGMHLYFEHPGAPLPNRANVGLAGFDLRGDGGYVVAPPSVHPSGRAYRWVVPPLAALPPLPDWLHGWLGLEEDEAPPLPGEPEARTRAERYARAALRRELARVRASREGGRNDQLNRSAFALGQLVPHGLLSEADAGLALVAAARAAGLPLGEARRTVASGLAAGQREPRRLPDFAGERS